jgi:hypothetical protein
MSGATPPYTPFAFMACTGTTLPFIINETFEMKRNDIRRKREEERTRGMERGRRHVVLPLFS